MAGQFATTRWSMVLAADGMSPDSGRALTWLCQTYWRPVYEFVRRRGHSPELALDLTGLAPPSPRYARLRDALLRRPVLRISARGSAVLAALQREHAELRGADTSEQLTALPAAVALFGVGIGASALFADDGDASDGGGGCGGDGCGGCGGCGG